MFKAVLIANRGEIAVRVARACQELGIRTVAVYSEADRDAPHVRTCDEAYLLGPAAPAASYLAIDRVVAAAVAAGVDAVHPGYGFLAENAAFARAVAEAGLTFVGPSPAAIEQMGDKLSARAVARAAGVPVVPGTIEPTDDPQVAMAFGEEHGYPVAVKAMFGGGGRGMKVVHSADGMRAALDAARREAEASFGRGECYLERYLERPRHIEIQVLADLDGTVVHLGERDCSLQRRHQKLVEEAPAAGLDPAVRTGLGDAAVRVAAEMSYTGAGTCEFLVDADGQRFYFLEMNTRLQVEHPVTELVTGIDLVHAQLRIAAGDGMGLTQSQITTSGHAIEVRINAEEPAGGFLPAPGPIRRLVPPLGPWVRFDTGVESGSEISRDYDSMIGKLVVWAGDRATARHRMLRALDELVIEGIPTTVPFHRLAMANEQFAAGLHSTGSVEREWDLSALQPQLSDGASPLTPRDARAVTVEVDGRRFEVRVFDAQQGAAPRRRRTVGAGGRAAAASGNDLLAPMQGTVVAATVEIGDQVAVGDTIVILEAMKMENTVAAHRAGVVAHLGFEAGEVVQAGAVLARIEGA